jgi:rhodanese-related sulfurtransferase
VIYLPVENHRVLALMLAVVLFLLQARPAIASDTPAPPQTTAANTVVSLPRYACGNLCLYAFARQRKIEVRLPTLLEPRYLQKKGATLGQLQQAAEAVGLHAAPVKRISYTFLQKTPFDIILHVKTGPTAVQYDHFVLFQGMEGNNLRILDLPKKGALLPYSDFLAVSDGYGLVLSTTPISNSELFAPVRHARITRFIMVAVLVLIVALLRSALKRVKKPMRPLLLAGGMTTILSFTIVLSVAYHCVSRVGLIHAANATEQIREAHFNYFLPKISKAELSGIVKGQNATIIDSRHKRDFESGHLPGAINVPVDSVGGDIGSRMGSIDKKRPLIVYCQSSACPFAGIVAKELQSLGYTDIRLYKGGWREWRTTEP